MGIELAIEFKDLRKVMRDAGYKIQSDEEFQRVLDFVKDMKANERKDTVVFGEQQNPGDDKTGLTFWQVE